MQARDARSRVAAERALQRLATTWEKNQLVGVYGGEVRKAVASRPLDGAAHVKCLARRDARPVASRAAVEACLDAASPPLALKQGGERGRVVYQPHPTWERVLPPLAFRATQMNGAEVEEEDCKVSSLQYPLNLEARRTVPGGDRALRRALGLGSGSLTQAERW